MRQFSNELSDYRTNLALAIIGIIVHGTLLFMHIKRRGVAVAEANAVSRSALGFDVLQFLIETFFRIENTY